MNSAKPRLLIFIVAYFAERTIEKVVRRIPPDLLDAYDVEVLIIDDGSTDRTFADMRGRLMRAAHVGCGSLALINDANLSRHS